MDSSDEILDILESKSSSDIKAAKLSTQATAIAMNVLTGIVTGPAQMILKSLQGYSDIADVLRGAPLGTTGQVFNALDQSIDSAAKEVSDGNKIYIFVNTVINPRVSKLLGL